jgi:hypothetical protein
MFPDDAEKGLYLFRDALVPRFGSNFIKDASDAVKKDTADRDELVGILAQYCAMVQANPYVSRRHKRKLSLMTTALNACPRVILMLLRKTTRLPLVNKFLV